MPRKAKDYTGQKFNNLTVLARSPTKRNYTLCVCNCGVFINVQTSQLISGARKTCGCSRIRHGLHNTPTYRSWQTMLQRCTNKNNTAYSKYGGVGILVSSRWNPSESGSFENFVEDMGTRPNGKTLNRVNGARLYSKETCEWATISEQAFDTKVRKDNSTGYPGVRFRKDRSVYEARISIGGKQYILYYGESLKEAVKARLQAEKEMYPNIKKTELLLQQTPNNERNDYAK